MQEYFYYTFRLLRENWKKLVLVLIIIVLIREIPSIPFLLTGDSKITNSIKKVINIVLLFYILKAVLNLYENKLSLRSVFSVNIIVFIKFVAMLFIQTIFLIPFIFLFGMAVKTNRNWLYFMGLVIILEFAMFFMSNIILIKEKISIGKALLKNFSIIKKNYFKIIGVFFINVIPVITIGYLTEYAQSIQKSDVDITWRIILSFGYMIFELGLFWILGLVFVFFYYKNEKRI